MRLVTDVEVSNTVPVSILGTTDEWSGLSETEPPVDTNRNRFP